MGTAVSALETGGDVRRKKSWAKSYFWGLWMEEWTAFEGTILSPGTLASASRCSGKGVSNCFRYELLWLGTTTEVFARDSVGRLLGLVSPGLARVQSAGGWEVQRV